MSTPTIPKQIIAEISTLNVGEKVDKKELVTKIYGRADYFVIRTFDVNFQKAKTQLFPKKFRSIDGQITRIS